MFTPKRTIAAVAGACVTGIATLTLAPGSAVAGGDDQHWMGGTVTSERGINVRSTPNLKRKPVGTMKHGQKFKAICKTKGARVGTDRTWYGVPSGSEEPFFVSGRFVDVVDDFELQKC